MTSGVHSVSIDVSIDVSKLSAHANFKKASQDMVVDNFFYFGGANFCYISLAVVCCALCALPFT